MASLKKCVELKCKDCTYDQYVPGSWRQQVEECRVKSCALWEVRPVTMETVLLRRKDKGVAGVDIDSLVDGLEDDEDEPVVAV